MHPYVSTGHVSSYGPYYGHSHGPYHGPAYGTSYGPSYGPSYEKKINLMDPSINPCTNILIMDL